MIRTKFDEKKRQIGRKENLLLRICQIFENCISLPQQNHKKEFHFDYNQGPYSCSIACPPPSTSES
jgi:hypothetical protein